ncbi:putative membrane protein [Staphylococcus aureus]|nr:putative membrane protein [Staphylococcus aureus]
MNTLFNLFFDFITGILKTLVTSQLIVLVTS